MSSPIDSITATTRTDFGPDGIYAKWEIFANLPALSLRAIPSAVLAGGESRQQSLISLQHVEFDILAQAPFNRVEPVAINAYCLVVAEFPMSVKDMQIERWFWTGGDNIRNGPHRVKLAHAIYDADTASFIADDGDTISFSDSIDYCDDIIPKKLKVWRDMTSERAEQIHDTGYQRWYMVISDDVRRYVLSSVYMVIPIELCAIICAHWRIDTAGKSYRRVIDTIRKRFSHLCAFVSKC